MSLRQLPLPVQKAVAGRLAVYPALAMHEAGLATLGHQQAVDDLEHRLQSLTAEETLADPTDAKSLDEWIDALLEQLTEEAGRAKPQGREASEPLLRMARESADQLLMDPDPLSVLFSTVLAETVKAYAAYGVKVPWSLPQSVALDTKHQLAPFPEPHGVRAMTLFSPGTANTVVKLVVAPSALNHGSILALPYVLMHECVAHVLQGPLDGDREHPHPENRWAEGWMDYVALKLHERVFTSYGSQLPGPFSPQEARNVAADAAHRARWTGAHAALRRVSAYCKSGVEAAATMRRLLERFLDQEGAIDVLLRLSLTLNASDLPPEPRDDFAQAVQEAGRRASRSAPLVPALQAYLQDDQPDAVRLVEETLNLR